MTEKRDFLTLSDLGRDGLLSLLERSEELKRLRGAPSHPRPLAGKTVAVLFEKASTRTRISFEVGIAELGAHPLTLVSRDLQIGRGESIEDTARLLSRYVHAIAYRTFGHDRVESLAKNASIPVINALTDLHHPLQLLADLMAVRAATGGRLEGVKVAWIGDGNNVAHSWIEAAGLVGLDLALACPPAHRPHGSIVAAAAATGRGRVTIVESPDEAVRGANVVTTDVWASMGQEGETDERKRAFAGYSVTVARMKLAAAGAIFLHCLPAHRGEEVEAAVIDGPASRVWDEAENRLHTQKALLERLVMGVR